EYSADHSSGLAQDCHVHSNNVNEGFPELTPCSSRSFLAGGTVKYSCNVMKCQFRIVQFSMAIGA
ncbi:hypothetical protein OFN56_39665, partial [Escherichia coli]|nr:hypothetical protein [Escherichia coli]